MKRDRIAIIDGARGPIGKIGGVLKDVHAAELGVHSLTALMKKIPLKNDEIDEVIFGCVAQPSDAANIARVIALNASLSKSTSAFTAQRNCASGMEAISSAALRIMTGYADVVIAGGVESMSQIPLLFNKKMTEYFYRLSDRKLSNLGKLKQILKFRPSLLSPRIALMEGLTDPTCGVNMGQTAENLAKEFGVARKEQDDFALHSHQKALKAAEEGFFEGEIVPFYNPYVNETIGKDECPRVMTEEKYASFKPYFDRSSSGTVTVANSCPTNDGASCMLLMTEERAVSLGLKPLGFIKEFAYAGLDAHRMGLGPVYATAKVLHKSGYSLDEMDVIEINEAFAAQVLACLKAFSSDLFCQKELGLKGKIGEIDLEKLNPNGGAIAIGHPVGVSGNRIVLTLLRQLEKTRKNVGLATLCIGGGQGAAMIVERE